MTKTELIKEVTSNSEYLSLCKRMGGSSLGKDLYQEMLLILIQYNAEKILAIKCQRCFVVKILTNMWNSTTSPFFYKYKKNSYLHDSPDTIPEPAHENENNIDEERLLQIEAELNNMHWYDKTIFLLYIECGSSRKLQAKTGIHYVSISKTVRKVKKILKERIK